MVNLMSKHYQCGSCGTIALCIWGSQGEVWCCGSSMALIDWDLLQDIALG